MNAIEQTPKHNVLHEYDQELERKKQEDTEKQEEKSQA